MTVGPNTTQTQVQLEESQI